MANTKSPEARWAENQRRWIRKLQRLFELTPVTQRAVAKRSGMSRAAVSMMAREATPVTFEVAKAACELHAEWREDLQAMSPTMSVAEWDSISYDHDPEEATDEDES